MEQIKSLRISVPCVQERAECRPSHLFLQFVCLFAQIPAEESEDEPPSSEERADAWLHERDVTEGNSEVAVAEETEGDGHRDGEETEQPDQMVTELQREDFLSSAWLCMR